MLAQVCLRLAPDHSKAELLSHFFRTKLSSIAGRPHHYICWTIRQPRVGRLKFSPVMRGPVGLKSAAKMNATGNPNQFDRCRNCGAELAPGTRQCPNCR